MVQTYQVPTGLDGAHDPGRRPPPRQQVRLRAAPSGAREVPAVPRRETGRHHRLQEAGRRHQPRQRARQARRRRGRTTPSRCGTSASSSTASRPTTPRVQHIDPETYPNDPVGAGHGAPPRPVRPVPGPGRLATSAWGTTATTRSTPLLGRDPAGQHLRAPVGLVLVLRGGAELPHLAAGRSPRSASSLDVAIHFFSRTRWDRMFTVVR